MSILRLVQLGVDLYRHWCYAYSMINQGVQMKTFKVILEDQWTNKLVFATIEDCVDLEDCVNHIHSEFPSHTIDQITEVN